MKLGKYLLSALFVLLLSGQSFASQNPTVIPNTGTLSGLTLVNGINAANDTMISCFSGATAPATPTTWQCWVDTTNSLYKIYNGSSWLPVSSVLGGQWVPIGNGVIAKAPVSTGSANAYVVTYAPAPTAYVTGQHYPFIANFSDTASSTVNANGLGSVTIKKNASVNLGSGDISNGAVVDEIYDGTNMQMVSQLGNGATGTVTSVATNNGLTGGTITTSGTIGLTTIGNNAALCNNSGGTAVPTTANCTVTGTGNLVLGTTPTLTTAVLGSSTATTQSPGDNSTKVATTAYVDAAAGLGPKLLAAVQFNGVSGISIHHSFNVTSVTRNGAGDYTVNFTSALPDALYYFNCQAGGAATSSPSTIYTAGPVTANPTASAYRFTMGNPGVSLNDAAFISCEFWE